MAGNVEERTILAVIAHTPVTDSVYIYQHQRMSFVDAMFKRLIVHLCMPAETTLIAHRRQEGSDAVLAVWQVGCLLPRGGATVSVQNHPPTRLTALAGRACRVIRVRLRYCQTSLTQKESAYIEFADEAAAAQAIRKPPRELNGKKRMAVTLKSAREQRVQQLGGAEQERRDSPSASAHTVLGKRMHRCACNCWRQVYVLCCLSQPGVLEHAQRAASGCRGEQLVLQSTALKRLCEPAAP